MPDGIKKSDQFFGDVDVFYNYAEANIFLKSPPKSNFNLIVYNKMVIMGLEPILQDI